MRALPFLLGLIAAVASAMPLLWMAILAVAQFGNLWMQPPYVREFPAIACFWLGFVAAAIFYVICLKRTLRDAMSPWLLIPIGVGLLGGIVEEVLLLHNAKTSFPIGFFEIAPLSWIIAGVIATKLPNRSIKPTGQQRPAAD
jgi:hypothetical protein